MILLKKTGNRIIDIDGNNLQIDGNSTLSNFKLFGKHYQASYEGHNLYDYTNTYSVTSGITTDEDGWITVSFDNTNFTYDRYYSYDTNLLNLETNTIYSIVVEIKEVTGDGRIIPAVNLISGGTLDQFDPYALDYYVAYSFSQLNANDVKVFKRQTRNDFSDSQIGVMTDIKIPARQASSITFRISVLADTTVTPNTFVYEPYTGEYSPSENYPQPIKTVTGENNLIISNKNLFDKDNIIEGKYIDNSGNLVDDTNNFVGNYIPINANETYYCSTTSTDARRIVYYDSSKTYISRTVTVSNGTLTIPSNAKYVRLSCYNNALNTLQLEKGTSATSYVAHQEQTYPVYLGNIELLDNEKIYKDTEWVVYKEYAKINSYNGETISGDYISTTGTLSTGATVYYKMTNPITTVISDATLKQQLDAVLNANLYLGTNVISISGDLVEKIGFSYLEFYSTFEFDKILKSGYNIKEDNDRITQKFANGHRKQIISDYEDCIIKINLGTFDLETTIEYIQQLTDGTYQYYSLKDNKYKTADFIIEERPEMIIESAIGYDATIEDFEITLLKAGD